MAYDDFADMALKKDEENWRFRTFLKSNCRKSDDALDELVQGIADEVWSKIDCTSCGRCCRQLKPELTLEDQERLAKRLGLSVEALRERYLSLETEKGETAWCFSKTPCEFQEGNLCSVYEDRPEACRHYPGLYKEDFRSRLISMTLNCGTCPVVFDVYEELKSVLRWRDRRRY